MVLVVNTMEFSTTTPASRSVAVKLYARMGPFLSSREGRSQETRTRLEVRAMAVMLSGGPEGTVGEEISCKM